MGGAMFVFPQQILKIGFSHDLLKKTKVKNVSSEDAKFLMSYYMQHSEQAHKMFVPSLLTQHFQKNNYESISNRK